MNYLYIDRVSIYFGQAFLTHAARPSMDDTYSATEIAAMMGVHRNTVYDLVAKGLFKTERYNDRPPY